MIRSLNQITFQGFGTVSPEGSQGIFHAGKSTAAVWELSGPEGTVCRARSDTWVTFSTGMSVLSVSRDGKSYRHYDLDKPVCIRRGMFFALSAVRGEARVLLSAAEAPERTGKIVMHNLPLEKTMKAERIYTFFYHEKEPGFLFSGESHPMPELTYVEHGSLHSVADGQDLLLQQGELVIYGPNQWHMQYADMDVAPRYVTISFDVEGVDLSPLLNRKFVASQTVVKALRSMLREQERVDAYSNDIILAQMKLLLLQLLRETVSLRSAKLQTANGIHTENEIIRRAQQYVSAHVREKLSVPLVARQIDVSPSYLTALFHKNLQISPGEYIRRIKLQESKQMIRENNLNFTEIAAELQYSTVHHFSRQFKEKFGITPTEYAKSVRS